MESFQDFVNQREEWVIENVYMKGAADSAQYLETWRKKRETCRFTEQFLRAMLASIFLPAANHQLKVDRNDQKDAEQLAFLIWADIMVSDDNQFMKKAFELLYSKTEKKFMSLTDFVRYMDSDSVD